MSKIRIWAIVILILGLLAGYFVYVSESNPVSNQFKFKFGLDLDGGTHLTYRADTTQLNTSDIPGSMDSLRQNVERRVNIFGVSEPIVQVEKVGLFSDEGNYNRLIVELPGITDIDEAVRIIGKTPLLEFKLASEDEKDFEAYTNLTATSTEEEIILALNELYIDTGLTGAQLKRANVIFDPNTGSPAISINFNDEGKQLFADLTRDNVGRVMAIFLDGQIISAPVIREEIGNGEAQITGDFTPEEAKQLVQDLNFGALPVPIELIETQSIGATLGGDTINAGINALAWGLIVIFLFLIIYYRLPGLIASLALIFYVILMLTLFKTIPVVLTASGIAGFILSIGMAVDANILIFERMKEEFKNGLPPYDAVKEGAKRAWPSIRDGNLSSLISAVVLYWLSGTSIVKGFALVFGIGVLVSMISAVIISRTWILAFTNKKSNKVLNWLFNVN